MSSLLGIHSLSKSFGTQILFEDLSFTVSQGDRIGLLGPNGSGKSTLLKILMQLEPADGGKVTKRQGLRIGYASQAPEFLSDTLENILLNQPDLQGDEIELLTRARILLGKAQFTDPTQNASLLSGGWKKRLDIARALMQEPDLLLLDEPTNHLDLEGILWLERLLLREKTSYIVVSHDRYFLENTSSKIIELNRCYPQGLFVSEGNLSSYMERKEEFLIAQAQQERGLASVVRDEVEWLRKSPKARTTKSRSRIEKAYELMDELSDVKQRNKTFKVDLEFSASERDTRKLLTTKNLSKSLSDKQLFKGVEITLSPGTRLGIVGKNGTGKTTLLKILAGMIQQDMGTIKYADNLKLVYFDQHREHIPSNISLREALAPVGDMVNYRGQSIHVNGWARKFLFSPDRLGLPVGCLSGGERARILISKLMLEPADILFLDEPTNDLDIATLEVIEESLKEFFGAVIIISHDRCLMDRVCTQILGLGNENEHQFFADYSQWEKASSKQIEKKEPALKPVVSTPAPPHISSTKKLSYKEQKELDTMEESITAAEQEIAKISLQLENNTDQSDAQKTLELYRLLAESQKKQETLFERWQYLDNKIKT
jgi:ABC transport system ATP-binding/permease protein